MSSSDTERRTVPWKQALGAALIGTPLLLALIELGLRLFGVAAAPVVLVDSYSCFLEFEPGTHVRHERANLVHDLWLDSDGFRVAESVARGEQTVPPAACRILALGDSFTEGFYVRPEETWPAQVQLRLRERGYDVRVDNGGFRSRSVQDARHAAMKRWSSLGHDLVVLEHTANDLHDLVESSRAGCDGRSPGRLARSRIYRLAQAAALRIAAMRGPNDVNPTAAECERAAADYREHLLAIAADVRDSGRQFAFVLMEPMFCSGLAPEAAQWNAYTRELRGALAAVGAPFIDATSALQSPGRTFAPVDNHPSPEGYAAAAVIIAEAFDAARLMERCRGAAGT